MYQVRVCVNPTPHTDNQIEFTTRVIIDACVIIAPFVFD